MSRKRMIPGVVGGVAAAVLLSAGMVMADVERSHGGGDERPGSHWMSLAELAGKLEAQGYTPYEIEIDDGAYEVLMSDEQGIMVETYINPTTGEPLPRRWDD